MALLQIGNTLKTDSGQYFVYIIFFSTDCPNGITNITTAMGQIAYPGSSSSYGVNETKCWKIQVPDIYEGIGIYFHL